MENEAKDFKLESLKDAEEISPKFVDDTFTRSTFLNHIQIDQEAILKLKPVDGEEPFYKRLTVRGPPDLRKLFDEEMEGGGEDSLGNASLLMTGVSMAEARQSIKRSKSGMRQSIIISDQGKSSLSMSLNTYANEIESPFEEFSGYDSEDSQPTKRL